MNPALPYCVRIPAERLVLLPHFARATGFTIHSIHIMNEKDGGKIWAIQKNISPFQSCGSKGGKRSIFAPYFTPHEIGHFISQGLRLNDWG
jgi:hypothetical protein